MVGLHGRDNAKLLEALNILRMHQFYVFNPIGVGDGVVFRYFKASNEALTAASPME